MSNRWRSVLGVTLSAGLLVWALRDVSPAEVADQLSRANPWLFLLATICATLVFPVRAARWRIILEPVASGVPFGPLWRSVAIGMMANNVLPARAGELARAYALTREEPRIPFSSSLASLIVDRAFDAVVLLALAAMVLFDPQLPRDAVIAGQPIAGWAAGVVMLTVALLLGAYLLVFVPTPLISVFSVVARRVSPKVEERGKLALKRFSEGLGALRQPRRFAAILTWTVAHWLLNALGFWLAFRAIGIGLPFTAALFVQAVIAFGVAVPSAPGFFGVFEAIAVITLGLYGISSSLAATWAIGFHVLTFIPITAIGAFYFVRLGLRMRELRAEPGVA